MSALVAWKKVEGDFALYYGMSVGDIMSMPWRRFVVLFDAIFPPEAAEEEVEDDSPEFDPVDDWNKMAGRTDVKSTGNPPIDLADYARGQGYATK